MTSKIYRKITPIVDSSDSETELNHSVCENINPAKMKTPYSTSKSRLKRRNTNVPAEDDEEELHTSLSSKINHRITPITDSSDSETELYHSVFEDQNPANMKTPSSTSRRRKRLIIASDEEEEADRSNDSRVNCAPAKRQKRCATINPDKVKRNLCLEKLKEKRARKCSFEGQPAGQSSDSAKKYYDDHYSSEDEFQLLSKNKCRSAQIIGVDSEDEQNEEEEESGEGSNIYMESSIDDDSQSQEVIPEKEEHYKRYVQMILSSVLDSEFLSSLQDDEDAYVYFDRAKKAIESELESKKNLVGSSTWIQFKELLEDCCFLESQPLPYKIKATCESCRLPRTISECLVFYEEQDGEKVTPPIKEFKVGCFCADRGRIYHELHHHDFELKESCIEKVHKVKAIGIDSDKEIVQHCIEDEEWLDILFKTFESLLNTADEYAKDGKKRRHMKTYCSSFHAGY